MRLVNSSCTAPALTGALLMALGSHAYAAWVIDPSARLDTTYEDNVRLDQTEESAIVTTATAQARVSNVTELSRVAGVAGVSYLTYSGVSDLDDQQLGFLQFSADRRGQRSSYGLQGSLRRDVVLHRIFEIPPGFDTGAGTDQTSGDTTGQTDLGGIAGGADINENVVRQQVERTQMIVSPHYTYSLSERSRIGIGYNYYGLRYDNTGQRAGLQDSDSQSVFARLDHDLSERNSVNVRVQASRFEPDQSIQSDNYEATLGWDRRITERADVGVDLGARRVERDRSADEGFVYGVRGSFRTDRARFAGSVQRSVLNSGFGDVVEADRLDLSYRRAISERVRFGFSARGYQTRRDGGSSNSDRSYFNVGAKISRDLSRAWEMGLGYTYRWTDRENDPQSASGNSVSLSLVYRPPSRL